MIPFFVLSILLYLLSYSHESEIPTYNEIYSLAQTFSEIITEERRYLHQHPELAFNEHITSQYIQSELESMNVSYSGSWAFNPDRCTHGAGVVAQIGTGLPPCVGLRADIDALALTEEVDVPFKSLHEGLMHACGHDAHTAMLLGAARILKHYEDKLPGTVRMIFQPAEEDGPGASIIVQEGFLSNYPPIQAMFGMHVSSAGPTNQISCVAGPCSASADDFSITITGSGGHAAMHHLLIDPIPAAVAIERALYDIYARELYFQTEYSGVISITYVKSTSSANNVIPDTVKMGGTIRSYSDSVMDFLRKRITEVSSHIGKSYKCSVEVKYNSEPYPVLYNDPELVEFFKKIAAPLSKSGEVTTAIPNMGAEDFSCYKQGIPILFANLGIGSGDEIPGHPLTNYSGHNPKFAVDERALPMGAAIHSLFAFSKLNELAQLNESS